MLFFVLQRVRNLYEDSNLFNFFGKVYLIESPEGFKVFFLLCNRNQCCPTSTRFSRAPRKAPDNSVIRNKTVS